MIRCLHHQVDDGLLRADHTEALKFASRIDPSHEGLILRFLLVAQLDVEYTEFVSLWSGFATLEEVACFGGCTGHEWPPRVYRQRVFSRDCPFSRSEPG